MPESDAAPIVTRRVVRFSAPPPAEVGQRCEDSAELAVSLRNMLLAIAESDDLRTWSPPVADSARGGLRTMAENLRGIATDLVLAAGYLKGAPEVPTAVRAARRRLLDALYEIHGMPSEVRVDVVLAEKLNAAWDAYEQVVEARVMGLTP